MTKICVEIDRSNLHQWLIYIAKEKLWLDEFDGLQPASPSIAILILSIEDIYQTLHSNSLQNG